MTFYLQVATIFLGAIYNGILAYEARGQIWKVLGSTATAIFLAGFAIYRLTAAS